MIRFVQPDDITIASAWWEERHLGKQMWTEALPAIGCVCEDNNGPAGMAWVYLDNSRSIGFIEHLVMRPGITVRQARRIGADLLAGLEAAAAALGYTHLVAYALPACISTAESCGYVVTDSRNKVAMIKALK